MNTYRLPKVMCPVIVHMPSSRLFSLPRPHTHKDVEMLMMQKYGMQQPDENMQTVYKYGFLLETGSFGSRSLAKECAEENNQLLAGVDTRYGLYMEHLAQ